MSSDESNGEEREEFGMDEHDFMNAATGYDYSRKRQRRGGKEDQMLGVFAEDSEDDDGDAKKNYGPVSFVKGKLML